jgi:hypothetical protein
VNINLGINELGCSKMSVEKYPKLIIIPWLTLIQSSSGSEALLFLISH